MKNIRLDFDDSLADPHPERAGKDPNCGLRQRGAVSRLKSLESTVTERTKRFDLENETLRAELKKQAAGIEAARTARKMVQIWRELDALEGRATPSAK